jgi:ABC-type molybdate transport system permease subunit
MILRAAVSRFSRDFSTASICRNDDGFRRVFLRDDRIRSSCVQFKGRRALWGVILIIMMLPASLSFIGFYQFMAKLHLLNSYIPLIVPTIASAGTVLFIRQYMQSVLSFELIDAARIDGSGEFRTFNTLIFPLITPALAALCIFSFVGSWNNFFTPFVLISSTNKYTLPMLVQMLRGDIYRTEYGGIYLGIAISLVSILIFYSFMSRFFISGHHDGWRQGKTAMPQAVRLAAFFSSARFIMLRVQNPVLPGFHPDPSILRVGEDYFIANSTFEWYPGIEISRSKDLVTWESVPSPLSEKRLLDMDGVAASCGVWAPCLTHADGLFWLIFTNVRSWNVGPWKDTPNYLVTAPSIEGPWSDPVFLNCSGFDPSLFHDDDGRKWLVNMEWDYRKKGQHQFSGILLQEYSPSKKALRRPEIQKILPARRSV